MRKRRIEKERKKMESSSDFDGRIPKEVWDNFVRATKGVVGRGRSCVVGPKEFLEKMATSNVMEEEEVLMEEKMTLFVEEVVDEVEEVAEEVEEEVEKHEILMGEQEEVVWTAANGLDTFRRQYVAHQQVRIELKRLIRKRIKQKQWH